MAAVRWAGFPPAPQRKEEDICVLKCEKKKIMRSFVVCMFE
jgi:hypothetical protein